MDDSRRALLDRLGEGLAGLPAEHLDPPPDARRGAVLVLIDDRGGDDVASWSVMFTRRQLSLSSHPGQISFPGGRVDDGEGIIDAALREANEEVGLDPGSVEVLGRLPAFYIPPSRFWMSAVIARWAAPHDLHPSPYEVAEILHVPLRTLHDQARLRAVPLSAQGYTWAWELSPGDLLWGATAVVTGILLDMMTPGWVLDGRPELLPPDMHVRPWESAVAADGESRSRPRLRDTASVIVSPPDTGHTPGTVPPEPARQRVWAQGVAEAVSRLERAGDGPVVVLVGTGVIGRIGELAAERLRTAGRDVSVVPAHASEEDLQTELRGAAVIVDAMIGRGLEGALADPFLSVARALTRVAAPIVAIDLPSGIHATRGLIGETVSADVTVTSAHLVPGHIASGALPFVADLYVVNDDGSLVRAHVDRPSSWAE